MKIAFTICSNNYYAQALVLGQSFLSNNPAFKFYIGLVDKKVDKIDYESAGVQVIAISDIEPDIYSLALKFNIVELNTAVKPRYFLYFFSDTAADEVFYLDPDIYVYQSLTDLSLYLETNDILLTPHILKPIPLDDKTPRESEFLNFGLYNLGFLALKKSDNTIKMLNWWKERTYRFGYRNLAKGLFVDQLWMNLAPLLFDKTKILDHPGYNMGPWNLHERTLTKNKGTYYVNSGFMLFFFHFSTFNPTKKFELHPVFNRFSIKDRADLTDIYNEYAGKLDQFHFSELNKIPCHYVEWRKEQLYKKEQDAYAKLPGKTKLLRKIKKTIPIKFKNLLKGFVQA